MFANVDEETLEIVNIFDCRPTEKEYTGALVELDDDMDYQCIEAFRDDADVIRLRTKSDAALIAKVRESDLAFIRTVRDDALRQTDWTRMDDNGLDAATKEAWRVYRQALRDLPQTTSNYKRVWKAERTGRRVPRTQNAVTDHRDAGQLGDSDSQ